MGWFRSHHHKERKQLRHAQVPLCTVQCIDCFTALPGAYLFQRFGGRCRHCYSVFMAGAFQMAKPLKVWWEGPLQD